jgi:predicted dehydrogenase
MHRRHRNARVYLADFIVGILVEELCAELTTFVERRRVDDNAQILLRYANGARGALWSSQVAPGNENGLRIRVYGAKGGLEWNQVNPNYLSWSALGQPTQIIARAGPAAGPAASRVTRVPPGHPEGYLEGFANIYQEIAHAIRAARSGTRLDGAVTFPSIHDGVRGVAFIEAAVASSKAGGRWMSL